MWKALQSGLSAVAGTAEPEYGPDSIRPVGYDLKEGEKCYSPLTKDDLKYKAPNYTNVETQTFYFSDEVYSGFAQVIHSNLVGLHTTAQFTFKLFKKETPDDYVWTSTKLEDFEIVDGVNFQAKNLSIVLAEDMSHYTINSSVNRRSEVIDLTMTRVGESVKFGKDGTTYYGTDPAEPWGSMRHVFWPRCKSQGKIILREYREPNADEQEGFMSKITDDGDHDFATDDKFKTKEETVEINGLGMYVMALQGMKPHHAAATWDFLNYQSAKHSVVVMEFTTPRSYNKTKVSVAMVLDGEGKIILATMHNETKHLEEHEDADCGWPVPGKITFTLEGKTDDGDKPAKVVATGELKNLSERVDVMAEIPQFVKNIVTAASGTKPYIYQFSNPFQLEIEIDGEKAETDEGYGYSESTFISSLE